MLTYNLDIETGSLWLRTTPGELALAQPYYCTEAGIFLAGQDFNTSRTFKDSYILFYTFEGCGTISQNERTVELPKNHALLMNCRYPQSYRTLGKNWRHYWIHLDGTGVKALENILIPNGKITAVHMPDACKYHFDTILRNMETESAQAILDTSLEAHHLLAMASRSILQEQEEESDTGKRIRQCAEYIRMHSREDISVEDLLAMSHLSRSYFLHLFRQQIGTAPYNYLLSCRITRAKELLETTGKSIAEIAEETGFRDSSAFSVRFSKMTSQSPLQYRKNALKQMK